MTRIKFAGFNAVSKVRSPKSYRNSALDLRIRKERTVAEARLLSKAKLAGVNCPTVLGVFENELVLSFVSGKRPLLTRSSVSSLGRLLAHLHNSDIIHGDFTLANILYSKGRFFVIDFGLGCISANIEDKATDAFTFLRSVSDPKLKKAFLLSYLNESKNKAIYRRLDQIESRTRYSF